MMKGEYLAKMLVMATNAHAGQFDKGGVPYILHPLKVMHYLKTDDEDLMIIALGHDIVEDTSVTFEDLHNAGFSFRVIAGIGALTKRPDQTFEEYKSIVMGNDDAIRVKMADLRHNSDIRRLKGVTAKDIERTVKYYNFYNELKLRLTTGKTPV